MAPKCPAVNYFAYRAFTTDAIVAHTGRNGTRVARVSNDFKKRWKDELRESLTAVVETLDSNGTDELSSRNVKII